MEEEDGRSIFSRPFRTFVRSYRRFVKVVGNLHAIA